MKLYKITAKIKEADEAVSKEPWTETYDHILLNDDFPLEDQAQEYFKSIVFDWNSSLRPHETARQFVKLISVIEELEN